MDEAEEDAKRAAIKDITAKLRELRRLGLEAEIRPYIQGIIEGESNAREEAKCTKRTGRRSRQC